MNYQEKIISLAQQNNGYIITNNIEKEGIPRQHITNLVNKGIVKKLGYGVAILSNCQEDELYTLSLKYSKIVYSHRTALYLNNMTNRQLDCIEVNIPFYYNIRNSNGFKYYKVSNEKLIIGETELQTNYGNKVKSYDKERCVCDLFLYDDFDNEEKAYAVKKYREGRIDYDKLFDYAKKLRVLIQVKSVFEVLQ